MNGFDVKRFGLILAVQAEIEGMKSINIQRCQNDNPPNYEGHHFDEKAEEIRVIVNMHDHQL